jgi:toxin ParE1/3/4
MYFDLEKAIAAWRRPYEVDPAFSVDDIEELESSLRDRVDAMEGRGLSEKEAFRSALGSTGTFSTAEREYRKVFWRKAKRQHRLKDELLWRLSMLRNYTTIALRNLRKHKGYTLINVSGLAIGLTCFALIGLFVRSELSYDRFHDKSDRIYRIARDNPNAAREWLATIRETCETLATQPKLGESRKGFGVPGCRSFSVGNYVVFFRAIPDGVEVSRVIHGSRDMRNT